MKTVRRPPYPKWNPDYFPCSSLTPLPLSSRRPSVSFGGFGLSEPARGAISRAKKHATRLNHDVVGSEHLLLGLVGETEDTAAKVLVNLGADLDKIAAAVESTLGPGKGVPGEEVPFSPRASRVLQSAGEVARELDHFWFGTEHLLLALMQEGGDQTVGPLDLQGITLDKVRAETLRILEERGAVPPGGGAKKARSE